MIIAELIGLGLICASSVVSFHLQGRFFERRLQEQDDADEARRVALYKQAKATERTVLQSDRAVRKLADETKRVHQDTKLLQQRVDGYFAHPAMKRLTNDGSDQRG